jgi:hypothetical protein
LLALLLCYALFYALILIFIHKHRVWRTQQLNTTFKVVLHITEASFIDWLKIPWRTKSNYCWWWWWCAWSWWTALALNSWSDIANNALHGMDRNERCNVQRMEINFWPTFPKIYWYNIVQNILFSDNQQLKIHFYLIISLFLPINGCCKWKNYSQK